MNGKAWTEDEKNKLKQLLKEGLTYLQISKILNKTKNSVVGKANRLNLQYLVKKDREPKIAKLVIECKPYIPPVLVDAPESLNLTIEDLQRNNCRYIPGEDHRFCGHKTMENSSYCEYHNKICHNPSPPLILKY